MSKQTANDVDPIKESVCRKIDSLRPEMAAMAHAIHSTPEIGYQEHNASRTLAGFLRTQGLDVTQPVAGMDTAFRAACTGQPGGASIAILAEYDALPGMGHGCAHNLIGTAAAGAAAALHAHIKDLKGSVIVLGCPAEEASVDGAGGKVRLIEAGCLKGIDAAFIFHPMPMTAVGGETSALVALEFVFRGRAAHAAGNPWDGANALDGVILTYNAINALRQHVRDGSRIHGIVTHGGDAPNIVPERAAARFFIRSQNTEYLKELRTKVENCARGAALASGTEIKINIVNNLYESVRTNLVLAEVLRKNVTKVGLKVEGRKKGQGSTDFGNVSRTVPACDLSLRLGDGIVPHSQEFLEAADSEAGYEVMIQGAKVLAMSALDLLLNPELPVKAGEEFKKQL
jgi:amidohydrolase